MKATIGLEIHVHLNTRSKLFCSCTTDIDDKEPNTEVCPICLGYPGSKPKLNRKAVDYGMTIALALESTIEPEIRFSRKNYFYPDMSKNFQITQYEVPLSSGGYLLVGDHRIGITRINKRQYFRIAAQKERSDVQFTQTSSVLSIARIITPLNVWFLMNFSISCFVKHDHLDYQSEQIRHLKNRCYGM